MKTKDHCFELVKFFADGRTPQVVRSQLTEAQAIGACNSGTTRKAGEWFLGYRTMVRRSRSLHAHTITDFAAALVFQQALP